MQHHLVKIKFRMFFITRCTAPNLAINLRLTNFTTKTDRWSREEKLAEAIIINLKKKRAVNANQEVGLFQRDMAHPK